MNAAPPPSRAYVRYVLAVLLVMYTLNYLDRYVLTVLLEPIKQDLGTSDTMMGFLVGPAFAALYTVLGLPIARWADLAVLSTSLVGALLLALAARRLPGDLPAGHAASRSGPDPPGGPRGRLAPRTTLPPGAEPEREGRGRAPG